MENKGYVAMEGWRDVGIRMEGVGESEEETSWCRVDSSSVLLLLQGPIYLHLGFWHQPRPVTSRKHPCGLHLWFDQLFFLRYCLS